MGIKRNIECDVCSDACTEDDFGTGFKDWCIVNGIAAKEICEGERFTDESMKTCLCPHCTGRLADFISDMQKEECKSIIKGVN